ncbi:Mitochondrial Carrier (MC) Family [Thraustotheca clavata]|uniref:Mitochondrial Carrier (MC) Family n=1 Tax=Thraustotheca clavata TaxID=74557 RepID=A0A1W0A028_9STRA|nr:Mitochondrial Carrier (MC) Family [Thraustotheca clavata]
MLDLRETTAGTVGAICNVYAGLPFDVAKIRLQTQNPTTEYAGLLDVVRKTTRTEGIRALWKGAIPAMSSAIAENSVLFTANGVLHRYFFNKDDQLTTFQEALLGGGAGLFAAMAITPTEVVKCRLQMHQGTKSLGVLRCIQSVYQTNGITGFTAGLSAVVLRDVPFAFFFFGAYQFYTSQLIKLFNVESRHELHPLAVMLAGGASGSTGWSFVFPADVIKSHMQIGEKISFRQAAISIWNQHGIRGFYRGWSAAVLRSFPADGCLFLGVEMTHRLFSYIEHEEPTQVSATSSFL